MRAALTEYFITRSRRIAWLVIAANFMLFATLLAVMFYLRWISEEWPAPFHFGSLLMVGAMTMFSLCGSVTMAIAAKATRLDDIEPAVRWIAIAISSWFVFLFLEIVEWVRLGLSRQPRPARVFRSHLPGAYRTHWLAATACVCWMTYVAVDVRQRDMLAVALYSHFLNFWWIVLVIRALFLERHSQGI